MRGTRWVVLSAVAGAAIGGVVFTAPATRLTGVGFGLLLVIVLILLVGGVPWLALRPGWGWWLASAVGLIGGFIGGAILLIGVLKIVDFCILGTCPPPNIYADALLFVIPLALIGMLQTLALRGATKRVTWLLTSLAGALILPYGFIAVTGLLGENIGSPNWPPFLIAGAVWGVVVGVGLTRLSCARAT